MTWLTQSHIGLYMALDLPRRCSIVLYLQNLELPTPSSKSSLFFAVKSSHNLVSQVVTYHDLDRSLIHTVLLECRSASLSRALFTTLYVAGPFSNAEYLSVLAFCDSTAFNDSSINFSISHVTSSPKTIELNMIVIWSVYLLSTAAIYRVSSKYLPLGYDVR